MNQLRLYVLVLTARDMTHSTVYTTGVLCSLVHESELGFGIYA